MQRGHSSLSIRNDARVRRLERDQIAGLKGFGALHSAASSGEEVECKIVFMIITVLLRQLVFFFLTKTQTASSSLSRQKVPLNVKHEMDKFWTVDQRNRCVIGNRKKNLF